VDGLDLVRLAGRVTEERLAERRGPPVEHRRGAVERGPRPEQVAALAAIRLDGEIALPRRDRGDRALDGVEVHGGILPPARELTSWDPDAVCDTIDAEGKPRGQARDPPRPVGMFRSRRLPYRVREGTPGRRRILRCLRRAHVGQAPRLVP